MKKFLFCLSLLAALLMVAGAALADGHGHWTPWKIVIGAADTYVWQPFNMRNESFIEQTGANSTAFVTQLTDQNFSWIDQNTKKGSDLAVVYQNSPCCYLSYTPHHWGHHGQRHKVSYNWPLFTEDMYQNTSLIYQAGGYQGHHGHHGYSSHHAAFVYQWGDGNFSHIIQVGKNDIAHVSQAGAFNDSWILQDGKGPNVAAVTQIGDLNYSDILQDGGINSAAVYQNGFGNVSLISQTDGHGYGCHSKEGINTAVVSQMGYMNESVVLQTGGGVHSAYVTQANFCFTASIPSCAGVGCR